ncbi:hypothetical protein HID58_060291, partial [Brassica napus]
FVFINQTGQAQTTEAQVHQVPNKKPTYTTGYNINGRNPSPNIETGHLDLGARQGGWGLNTCKNLGHQYDTRRPPRLDRNLFAQPPKLTTDNLRLKSFQRNHSHSTPFCLHAGEFHRSNEISSDYVSPQTLDRRAENHCYPPLVRPCRCRRASSIIRDLIRDGHPRHPAKGKGFHFRFKRSAMQPSEFPAVREEGCFQNQ